MEAELIPLRSLLNLNKRGTWNGTKILTIMRISHFFSLSRVEKKHWSDVINHARETLVQWGENHLLLPLRQPPREHPLEYVWQALWTRDNFSSFRMLAQKRKINERNGWQYMAWQKIMSFWFSWRQRLLTRRQHPSNYGLNGVHGVDVRYDTPSLLPAVLHHLAPIVKALKLRALHVHHSTLIESHARS